MRRLIRMVTCTPGEAFRNNITEVNLAMGTVKVNLSPSGWKHLKNTEWRRWLVEVTTL